MRRLSIRWLLLGVAGASLLLPVLAFVLLRLLDPYLVQQTEKQLNAEAALIAESYRTLWCRALGRAAGDPRPPNRSRDSFVAEEPQIRDLGKLAPPMPAELPARSRPAVPPLDGAELSSQLARAQLVNLSGVRVLDSSGCARASSRGQIDRCFGELPEVIAALGGLHATAIRQRTSDEPLPPLGSLRRRGDLRVFVAHPVFDSGELIGAIWLSRTAESGLEFLVKQRRGLFYGGLLLMGSVLVVSALFAGFIIRPLGRMAASASLLTRGEASPELSAIVAPKEIHALGVAFDALTSKLQMRARYVSDFAAQVSHELKTPLTSIRGALELLREPGPSMEESQRQRFFANMDAAAERTERLVERLLLLARLENPSERLTSDPVSLGSWLEANRRRWTDVDFQMDPAAIPVERSALELDSIVGNLVDNALRYRRETAVQVRFESRPPWLVIHVSDDGPAISAANRSRLFVRFFTTERDRGGTGLGLAIVKATAEGRGGRVQLTSDDLGTRVAVTL